jgi:hypothetical protein
VAISGSAVASIAPAQIAMRNAARDDSDASSRVRTTDVAELASDLGALVIGVVLDSDTDLVTVGVTIGLLALDVSDFALLTSGVVGADDEVAAAAAAAAVVVVVVIAVAVIVVAAPGVSIAIALDDVDASPTRSSARRVSLNP